jgi:ribosomal protein S18 acetylase RimI-like enzyme
VIIIRDAANEDVAPIAALHAESWRSGYRNVLSHEYLEEQVHQERLATWQARFSEASQKPMYVLVAEANAMLAGFVSVFPDEDAVFGSYLDNLHVVPALTGQGIGRKLLLEAAKRLVATGSRGGLYLWVIEQNQRALRFYEKAGAQVVGSKANSMPDGRQVLALRCYWRSPKTLVLPPEVGS